MNLADPLIAAVLERTGLRQEIAAPKVHARLSLIPEADRPQAVQRLLHADPLSPEWLAFAEFCLIHETYFFRHEGQLEFLAKKVVPALLQERLAAGRHEFKIWCAACSSGEEAYSAGLLLRDAIQSSRDTAAKEWHVSVVGTDLSAEVLAVAKRGEYSTNTGLNSFRDIPTFARHHFLKVLQGGEKTWRADESLRRTTSFQQRNLVSDPAPVAGADLVLCRNVLIYMDEIRMRRAVTTLVGALRPGGVLVLGPADMLKDPEAYSLSLLQDNRAMLWKKEGLPK
jgi:chemotaxis methyl-accepting protein methylase